MKISNCHKCNAEIVIRVAKKGNTKGNKFLGCSNFPKCNYTLNMGDYTKKRLGTYEVNHLNERCYKELYRAIEENRINIKFNKINSLEKYDQMLNNHNSIAIELYAFYDYQKLNKKNANSLTFDDFELERIIESFEFGSIDKFTRWFSDHNNIISFCNGGHNIFKVPSPYGDNFFPEIWKLLDKRTK